jgi:hypothetical protein
MHLQPFRATKFPDGDPFHHWADSQSGLNRINSVNPAIRFDSSIINQSSENPHAPVPIARIIDKTDGDLGILSPNLNIGLAEYSNANFISKGTARSTIYQYPRYSQLEFGLDASPGGVKRRYARFRQGIGEQDYWVGVSSRMARFANATVPPDAIDFGLDDKVHEDYGRKLFSRAIGYSAGLIDYFFRNQIDGHAVDLGCFFPPFIQTGDFALSVRTAAWDPNAPLEQTGTGRIVVVVHYRVEGQSQYFNLLDRTVYLDQELGVTWELPRSLLAHIPANATNIYYTIAYRGPLGAEGDAVIGGIGQFFGLC